MDASTNAVAQSACGRAAHAAAVAPAPAEFSGEPGGMIVEQRSMSGDVNDAIPATSIRVAHG